MWREGHQVTKILLIEPGASFSTLDVFTGVKAGLEAHGCEVVTYHLSRHLQRAERLIDGAIDAGAISDPENPFALACERLPAIAIAERPDAVIAISGGNVHPAAIAALRLLAGQRRQPFPTAVYLT